MAQTARMLITWGANGVTVRDTGISGEAWLSCRYDGLVDVVA